MIRYKNKNNKKDRFYIIGARKLSRFRRDYREPNDEQDKIERTFHLGKMTGVFGGSRSDNGQDRTTPGNKA